MMLFGMNSIMSSPSQAADYDSDAIERSMVWVDIQYEAEIWAPGYWFDDDIAGYYQETSEVVYNCSGWFVSESGDIVTAGHCLEMDDAVRADLIDNLVDEFGYSNKLRGYAQEDWQIRKGHWTRKVIVGQPQGVVDAALDDDGVTAQVVKFQRFDNGDNALLRVAGVNSVGVPLAAAEAAVGSDVTAVGFAGAVGDVSDISRQRASFKEGTVSSQQFTDNGVPTVEIDAPVTFGMSGGPTIDENGAVIGVNSFRVVDESQPFNFVTDTETLRRFLVSNGVTPAVVTVPSETTTPVAEETEDTSVDTPKPSASKESGGGSNMMLYGLVGLAAVLLLVIVVLVVMVRRRPAGTKATPSSTPQEAAGPPQA